MYKLQLIQRKTILGMIPFSLPAAPLPPPYEARTF